MEVISKGGPIMYPLALCSVISLAIALERLFYFLSIRGDSQELMADVKAMVGQGKVMDAVQLAKRAKTPVGGLIVAGLTGLGRSAVEMRERVQGAGSGEIAKLERNLPFLETMATVTPLLGLLGTVIGIIRNFNILAMTQGLSSGSALSGGIAEALIATAGGLSVAIPSLLFHAYFSSRVDSKVTEMNRVSADLLDVLSVRSGDLQ